MNFACRHIPRRDCRINEVCGEIDKTLSMDSHQRKSWLEMIDFVSEYRAGVLGLGDLVDGLRGLFVEADPHDAVTRDDFESRWSSIDYEHDLRTQPWAPLGVASDATLAAILEEFCSWVKSVVASDTSSRHH